jgi:DNA-directed RNA polymerase subunit RPC12/RpoP
MEYVFVFWIAMAILTAIAANSRNRHAFGWLILGLLFGIFALAALLIMKPEPEGVSSGNFGLPTPETHFLCPDCNKLIPKNVSQCPKCGCKIIPEPSPKDSNKSIHTPSTHLADLEAIEKLASLKERGIISEEEFSMKKKKLLDL